MFCSDEDTNLGGLHNPCMRVTTELFNLLTSLFSVRFLPGVWRVGAGMEMEREDCSFLAAVVLNIVFQPYQQWSADPASKRAWLELKWPCLPSFANNTWEEDLFQVLDKQNLSSNYKKMLWQSHIFIILWTKWESSTSFQGYSIRLWRQTQPVLQ